MSAPTRLGFAVPSTVAAPKPPQSRVGFRANADLPWLLVPIGVVSQVALDPVLAPIPNVKPWLVGVLNARGNLVPVFDLAVVNGLPPTDIKTSTVLVLQPNEQPFGVLCLGHPHIALASPASATQVPLALAALANFLVTPMQFEGALAFEFRFRDWINLAGRSLPGSA